MSDSSLLIHIGYPKTASSWLQADVFLDKTTGFCVPWEHQDGLCHHASDLFINCDVFSQSAALEFFQPGLISANQNQLIPVLSNEFLSGCFFFTPPNYSPSLPGEIAERLKSTFKSAKILIMIREQQSMLLSAYRQMLIMGNSLTIEEFINTGENGKDITKHPSVGNLENLKFDQLIAKYYDVFGQDKTLVLPMEYLKKDMNLFFKTLYDFIQIPTQLINNQDSKNVGLTGGRLAILRQLNKTISLTQNNPKMRENLFKINYKVAQVLDPVIPKKINESVETKLKQFIQKTVGNYYQESNQKTSKLIGIDLAKLKYPC
ncbi:hypothetical protein [Gloeocapsa sp. PCC 73106]|uniref:hypothetical protein n=1 Tax=Gloeocapsa sp. PCC 73106 TaxID=102232 RepID=UPI0002ACFB03|nr:hypothetical protein [Gloeocapsa sp. PCC 73106]ELR98387.1 hypothetical protein GLO73106DRAFT_00022180 [Gloeocapsa sp. PCC 73106]